MYQRIGASAFKKDLKNIKALCQHLGNPQDQFKSIHIAGTNGKGSVTHFISSVLVENDLKVGLYTSPHYLDFRERIKIGNQFISHKEVLYFVNANMDAILKIKPSFFEITVAMAFDHFAKQKVDIAIIETGLGGRLDSTNIINPELAIITNIGLDHQQMLGNTLKKIAFEKAGIIKKETPILIGEKQAEVKDVFLKQATKRKTKLKFASNYLDRSPFQLLSKKFPASYQKKNINTAINALKMYFPKLSSEKIVQGICKVHKNVYYLGRWHWISKNPKILADSAHNEDGLKAVLDQLKTENYKKIHYVLGFVNDKSLKKILQLFPAEAYYYFAKANIPRGKNAKELAQLANEHGLKGKAYSSVRKALAAAKTKVKKNELVYLGGSIFVVAEGLKR